MPPTLSVLWKLIRVVRNWPMYLLCRFGLCPGIVRYRLRCGLSLITRSKTNDRGCLVDVWLDHAYDPNHFSIPFDWASARTIVDIGAHIGAFSLYAAWKAQSARVICLEPDQSNFALLKRNIESNALIGRIAAENIGIGNGEEMTLYTFPGDCGGNSLFRSTEGGTPVTIHTLALRELFDRYSISRCDYLKLDCEGAEYEALYSMPKEDLQRVRCIGMEYHHFSLDPAHRPESLIKFLEENGFNVTKHRKSMLIAIRT
ncbi:MAG: FkbM family methyltransferase [Candidatus Peribacteraceae bacterium]